MNISSELEKLISLRDLGELSQEEFEKAKALLLSGENAQTISAREPTLETLADRRKKGKTQLLVVVVLLTFTATLSGVSASINPSPIKVVLVVLWVVAATLAWASYSRESRQ